MIIGTNAATDFASCIIDPINNPIALPAKPNKIYVSRNIKKFPIEFVSPIIKYKMIELIIGTIINSGKSIIKRAIE